MSNRAFLAVAVACAAILAASLWSWGLPLTNDGPCHVFAAWVANHIDDPALGLSRVWRTNDAPSSNGFHQLMRALEPVLGWRAAWRVNVIVVAELFALSWLFL